MRSTTKVTARGGASLGLVFFIVAAMFSGEAVAAQICGCKDAKGKVRRLTSGVPLTCRSTQTLICWNEASLGLQCTTVTASADITVTASCPAGTRVVGGGYEASPDLACAASRSRPTATDDGWEVYRAIGLGCSDPTVIAYAICCPL